MMTNADNVRLLSEERALAEAETSLAREEQALAPRLDAFEADDPGARAQVLLGRLAALEAAGPNAELARAKAALQAIAAPDPGLALTERTAALSARRAALPFRDAAAKALTAALAQVEPATATRRKNVDAVDNFVGQMERAWQQTLERRRAQVTPGPAESATMPATPKVRG